MPLFLDILREQTAASPERRSAALAGLAAYQTAARPPARPERRIAASAGRARLLAFGGNGPPLVLVPSLINPARILDLDDGVSLAEWLAGEGFAVHLVDWGAPGPGDAAMDVGDHVTALLLPLIDALGEPPLLVGYCLGGTMALAAAVLRPPRALALIATPFRFVGFGDVARAEIAGLWSAARSPAERIGLVPMEVLQAGFWRLDPARTITKYELFGRLDPASAQARAFVALEDWANDGAPLPFAAGRQLMEDFVGDDAPGRGQWRIGDRRIAAVESLHPALDIISLNDRIVPAASAVSFPQQLRLGLGHVGMIVGSRAREQLWQPLATWLSHPPSP